MSAGYWNSRQKRNYYPKKRHKLPQSRQPKPWRNILPWKTVCRMTLPFRRYALTSQSQSRQAKLLPLSLTAVTTALPRTLWALAEQRKSLRRIWRRSTFCTTLKLKTALPHPKNRKSLQAMSVGAVCLWRLMKTMRLGQMNLRSCM